MKTSKTITFIIVFFWTAGSVLAQPDSVTLISVTHKVETMVGRMERELTLTSSQKELVSKLLVKRFENLKDGASLETVNRKTREKLSGVITKEQYALYLKLREDTRKQKEEFLRNNPEYRFNKDDLENDF